MLRLNSKSVYMDYSWHGLYHFKLSNRVSNKFFHEWLLMFQKVSMTGLTGGDNCQNVAFIETPVQNMKASSVAIELISIEHCKAETNAIRTVKLRIEEYHNVPMSRDVIESQKVMETHQLWGHFACCFTTHLLATQALFISATFSFQIIYLVLDFVMTTLNESATKRNKHIAFRIEKCKWPYCNWFSFWIGFVEKVAWFSGPFTCSGT